MQAHNEDPPKEHNPYDYYNSIVYYLFRQFKDFENCEEAAHRACFKAIKFKDKYVSAKGGYYAWLYKIAYYSYLDILRKQKTEQKYLDQQQPDTISILDEPDYGVHRRDNLDMLHEALKRLTRIERHIISLRYIYDYKNSEIAEILHCSRSYVAYIIYKAKRKIKIICNKNL